jgi:hypothetical protein
VGLEVLHRERAKESLRDAGAAMVPQMEQGARDRWFRDQNHAAGLT